MDRELEKMKRQTQQRVSNAKSILKDKSSYIDYSNAIATTSNVIITAFTGDLKRLDVGGILVTLYRLISDQKFIYEIKRDFLKNEIYKMVVGEQYDFMEGK